jgi:hypothetical protein
MRILTVILGLLAIFATVVTVASSAVVLLFQHPQAYIPFVVMWLAFFVAVWAECVKARR